MRIYFEDDHLAWASTLPVAEEVTAIIDASAGVNSNIDALDMLLKRQPDAVVYTNSIFAFSNIYAWNEKLKVPEIYIRQYENGPFARIDSLTTRELREGHNLAKMYVSGEFDNKSRTHNN